MKRIFIALIVAGFAGFFVPVQSQITDRLAGVQTGLAVKAPVKVATTSNITLSGEQTIDSTSVVAGDRVLVREQTDATENGIYVVSTSAWTRAADFDGNRDVANGTLVVVPRSSGQDYFYQTDATDPVVIGTSEITFTLANDPNITYDITDAEIAAGVTPDASSKPPGYTTRYPNGLADALLQADESGGATEIIFAASETISTGLTAAVDYLDVTAIDGAILTYSGTGVAVTLGNASEDTYYNLWDVPIKRDENEWDDGTDTTSIGLQIRRIRHSEIYADIENFNYGLNSFGITGGNVHNTISIKHILDNRIGVLLDRDGASAGWNNDNEFWGGRIGYRSGTIDTAIANSIVVKHLSQAHASDNATVLFGTAFEISATSGSLPSDSSVLEINGLDNRIAPGRFENSNAGLTQYILFGASSARNVIEFGRYQLSISTADFVNDLSGTASTNRVFGFNSTWNYGPHTRIVVGAIEATGRPSSANYGGDDDSEASVVARNLNSSASRVWAGKSSSTDITSSILGTGRTGIGKDAVANMGMLQVHNPITSGGTDETRSWNVMPFLEATTDDSGDAENFDSVTIPINSITWVKVRTMARYDDGTKFWLEDRIALIERGAGAAAVSQQSQVSVLDPDTAGVTAVVQVPGSQLQMLLTGVAATAITFMGTIEWQTYTDD